MRAVQVSLTDHRYLVWGSQLLTAEGLARSGGLCAVVSPAAFGSSDDLKHVERERKILWP